MGGSGGGPDGSSEFGTFRNSPQCLHLIASVRMSSAQKGHDFNFGWLPTVTWDSKGKEECSGCNARLRQNIEITGR